MLLYRVTKNNPPAESDLKSHWDLGIRPAKPRDEGAYREVSVFDTPQAAAQKARARNLGSFIAVLEVPDDSLMSHGRQGIEVLLELIRRSFLASSRLSTQWMSSRLGSMEFEIWASDSGNRLFVTPDLDEALTWALDYWLTQGAEALDALSVGDSEDEWVVSGAALRDLLKGKFWRRSATLATGARVHFEESPQLLAS